MADDTQPTTAPPGSPATTGYAAWRAVAEVKHAEMMGQYWKLRRELSKLSDEINDLEHVMGNGASGGTAWTLHPLHTAEISDPTRDAYGIRGFHDH